MENVRFGSVDCHFENARFESIDSLFAKVSWKTFVLEVWILTFGESLVENVRFGRLDSHFCRKSCGKRSFWKSGFSLLAKVSWKTFVLEGWILTFVESLVQNINFGSLDSHFENVRFGNLDFHFL